MESKVIAIAGTNASGKSALGLELAQQFNGEIISADSRQVFRGFDLCCGKVTHEERQLIPHHMLDIRNIGEPFSVADFQALTYALIPQIMARGKLPFIVGGTGLYIRSVVDGYELDDGHTDLTLRKELETLSVGALQNKLSDEGREYLKNNPSDYQNKRRLIRVIEKTTQGKPLKRSNNPKYNVLQIGVTWPKELLHKRIEERLKIRIKEGMIDEVKTYLDNGGNQAFLYDLGLEYRYILWYLTGKYATPDDFFQEMSGAIKRFSKMQMTWFKRDKRIQWIDMTNNPFEQAKAILSEFIKNNYSYFPHCRAQLNGIQSL